MDSVNSHRNLVQCRQSIEIFLQAGVAKLPPVFLASTQKFDITSRDRRASDESQFCKIAILRHAKADLGNAAANADEADPVQNGE